MRKAKLERNGSVYRDKQESLDHIDFLERTGAPIHGLEIVRLTRLTADTDMYKTVWYVNQDDVHDKARAFIREQMVGVWNYAEFK